MYTDPIADMLTRIRNAYLAQKLDVVMPYSKLKEEIVAVLDRHELVDGYSSEGEGATRRLSVVLAYDDKGKPTMTHLKRESKPSLRLYKKAKEIGFVRGGYGLAIVTTSQGVMSDQEARKKNLGGEVIAVIW